MNLKAKRKCTNDEPQIVLYVSGVVWKDLTSSELMVSTRYESKDGVENSE